MNSCNPDAIPETFRGFEPFMAEKLQSVMTRRYYETLILYEKDVLPVFFGYDLYGEHDFHFTDASGHPQGDFVLMAIKHEVETRGADGKVPNLDSLKKRRQHRTDETHQAMRCVDS